MKLRHTLLSLACVFFLTAFSCGQNGPTQHSVTMSWTQSTTTGVTANCIYRGTAAGVYTLPALFCSTAPITTYKDTAVTAGTSYHYAVTAQKGSTESPYSNDLAVVIPADVAPPSSLAGSFIALLKSPFEHGKTVAYKSADGQLTAIVR